MNQAPSQAFPRAKAEGLIVQELPDEVLVYDTARDEAHCLNETVAAVWKHCDGKTTVAEIQRLIRSVGLSPTKSKNISELSRILVEKHGGKVPQTFEELEALSVEVSVLGAPEPAEDVSELDPLRFGVIVSHGRRRGVLLPNVTGIADADEQMRIALRKAGISESEPYRLERFTVKKARL